MRNIRDECADDLRARQFFRRQAGGERSFFEGAARGFGRVPGGLPAMTERGRFGRENLFRLVPLGAVQPFESRDLRFGQLCEQAKETAHVVVFGVAPELPIFIGRAHIGVQPHRACRRFPHLRAGRGGDQR
jgi:hypothetical protein